MPAEDRKLGRATAGQLRRAGFGIVPPKTADHATTGFSIVCDHGDPISAGEHAAAVKRGDAFPDEAGK